MKKIALISCVLLLIVLSGCGDKGEDKDIANQTVKYENAAREEVESTFKEAVDQAFNNSDIKIEEINYSGLTISIRVNSAFDELSDEEKANAFVSLDKQAFLGEYTFEDENIGTWSNLNNRLKIITDTGSYCFLLGLGELQKDGKTIFKMDMEADNTDGSSNSSSSSSRTCPNCNGTGAVKYNYGASDAEAYADGQDPYQIGECPMCHGTGSVSN